jgi:6-phosphogluconolactonase
VLAHAGKDGYAPHIHCAKCTADGKYLCVVEVGYHALCLYDTEHYEKQFEIRTKPVRPRQVVCTHQCVYLLTEGGMTVDVYVYQPDSDEKLVLAQSLSCLPEGFRGMGGAGGIRISPDGKTIFASIRGVDVIAAFSVGKDGLLEKRTVTKLQGSTPRDFNVSPDGKHLLVGLQKSDSMAVYGYDQETGALTLETENFPVPSCSCVEFGRC